jgi:hypothetical protein
LSTELSIALTPGEQVEVLADEAQLGEAEARRLALGQRGDLATADHNRPGGRVKQRGHHQQQRRLARSARPVKRDHLAGRHLQRDAIDRTHRLPADRGILLDEVAELEHLGPNGSGAPETMLAERP